MLEPGNYLPGSKESVEKFLDAEVDKMTTDRIIPEIKDAYGEDYFAERVHNIKSFVRSGICDAQPVVQAYTNALLDVFPQKR